jgi:trans-aconitate 2-methyltransferase
VRYETFFQRLEPDARVLDLGCGNGHLTAQIAQHVPSGFVLGVDNCFQTLVSAMLNYRIEFCPNLRFFQADAKRLRLEYEPFDYVLSKGCLHYLQHPGQAFAAIASNLKDGGTMYCWALGKNSGGKVNSVLRRLCRVEQWKSYLSGWRVSWSYVTIESCRPWLNSAGLTWVQGLMYDEELSFPDRSALLDWFRRNWAYSDRIPYALLEVFEEQLMDSYLCANEGRITASRTWLVLEAKKTHSPGRRGKKVGGTRETDSK